MGVGGDDRQSVPGYSKSRCEQRLSWELALRLCRQAGIDPPLPLGGVDQVATLISYDPTPSTCPKNW